MKEIIVQLVRRFRPTAARVGTLDWLAGAALGPDEIWPQLEAHHRVLILAEAGAGKTFEARAEAQRLLAKGKRAFFIRIEAIDDAFPDAFEVGTADAFDDWLDSTDEAWFFLDSVDEAQLETPAALEAALRLFGERIHGARERAHIYVTSRVDAWEALPDRTLLDRYLPYGEPAAPKAEDETLSSTSSKEPALGDLKIYRLTALNDDEIRLFAAYHNVSDIDGLVTEIDRRNLRALAERPFDLRSLIAKWNADRALGDRFTVFRRVAELHLAELAGPNARALLASGDALKGTRALAAAVTMTGRPRLSLSETSPAGDRLDPSIILPDWSAEDRDALLRTGIFDDVVFGTVRFRHRDMRELLAAEFFRDAITERGGRDWIEPLFFRNSYGEAVIVPRLRPVLTWLLLLDDPIRTRALALEPEIATEGGDPSRLPLDDRRTILTGIVERIARDQRSGLDNDAIARIARDDLTADVLALIERYGTDEDVIFFVGRLVWQGQMTQCVPSLLEIARNPARGLYARIASIRAVMTVGSPETRETLWLALSDEVPLDRKLLAEILGEAAPTLATVARLLNAIPHLTAYNRFETTGLSSAIHQFIDRLPIMADAAATQPLLDLAIGVNALLDRQPHLERGECHVSEEYVWLMGPALHVAQRLVAARAAAALTPAVLSIMLKISAVRFWRRDEAPFYKDRLAELVPGWVAVNDALYWASVDERRTYEAARGQPLIDDPSVSIFGHFWQFDAAAFGRVVDWISERADRDDRLVALSRAATLYMIHERPDGWLDRMRRVIAGDTELASALERQIDTTPSPMAIEWAAQEAEYQRERDEREHRETTARAQWIAALKADPSRVRTPPRLGPGEFSSDQFHLMRSLEDDGLQTSRSRGADWRALAAEFGDAVAQAYRDAAVAHWRSFEPGLRSEGANTGSIPYSLVFAMTGLEIEATENEAFPNDLDDAEVRRALRYIVWELNGFPRWFAKLYRAFPGPAHAMVWGEVLWELEHSLADQPLHYILHGIVYHAPWLQAEIAPALFAWLRDHDVPNSDVQRYSIVILTGGGIAPADLAALARAKVDHAIDRPEQRAAWYALWVENGPATGIPALEAFLDTLHGDEASLFAQAFIVALLGDRRGGGGGAMAYRTPDHLKQLYVLMYRYIRASDDIERANKGVYSPTVRDDAQEARNRLFNLLTEIPGEASYRAIKDLERDHPEESYRRWATLRAHTRAVADADEPLWEPGEVGERLHLQTMDPVASFLRMTSGILGEDHQLDY
jgi:hypothetical protein